MSNRGKRRTELPSTNATRIEMIRQTCYGCIDGQEIGLLLQKLCAFLDEIQSVPLAETTFTIEVILQVGEIRF